MFDGKGSTCWGWGRGKMGTACRLFWNFQSSNSGNSLDVVLVVAMQLNRPCLIVCLSLCYHSPVRISLLVPHLACPLLFGAMNQNRLLDRHQKRIGIKTKERSKEGRHGREEARKSPWQRGRELADVTVMECLHGLEAPLDRSAALKDCLKFDKSSNRHLEQIC